MADIFHTFEINATPARVFEAISDPAGLDQWWSLNSHGEATPDGQYELGFGPGYDWGARVTRCEPGTEFELELTSADPDWQGTRVGFRLSGVDSRKTLVEFSHRRWPHDNDHYRISCYCWAMYLRILKRYVEFGEEVPYSERLSV